jgi:hypothetical protein
MPLTFTLNEKLNAIIDEAASYVVGKLDFQ